MKDLHSSPRRVIIRVFNGVVYSREVLVKEETGSSATSKMSGLPAGLPPLPRSLQGLLRAGSAHWREMERIHMMKVSIQQDLNSQSSPDDPRDSDSDSGAYTRLSTRASLQAAINRLRREMVLLRQLDMSLLCQFWRLNENIQEVKHVAERMSETNADCSWTSNGLDHMGSESLPSSIDEEDEDHGNLADIEDEDAYMEPVSCRHNHNRTKSRSSSITYESNI